MKILFIAPQPFFEDRGTPIDVDLGVRSLAKRGNQVDLLTFHLGQDVHYDGVQIHRILNIPFIRSVPPGFSGKKLICDFFLFFKAIGMASKGTYQVIHAVEESVYIALVLKVLFGIPYIYDMDSSLAQQIIERFHFLRFLAPVLNYFEGLAVSNARAVAPVCDAIAQNVERYKPRKIFVLHDISLLQPVSGPLQDDLRGSLGIQGPIVMYVGNLEHYQGIDLLLESFALVSQRNSEASLVVIGGKPEDISTYTQKVQAIGIADRIYLVGPRPLDRLAEYLSQADIVVSPRIKGINTPMKVYSYLDSGTALLATKLLTHTQVMTEKEAMLADPEPEAFAQGMACLLDDPQLRTDLAQQARDLVAKNHTLSVLEGSYKQLYDWVIKDLEKHQESRRVRIIFSVFALLSLLS